MAAMIDLERVEERMQLRASYYREGTMGAALRHLLDADSDDEVAVFLAGAMLEALSRLTMLEDDNGPAGRLEIYAGLVTGLEFGIAFAELTALDEQEG